MSADGRTDPNPADDDIDLADEDDEDDDGDDLGEGEGGAAVLHRVESLGVRFDFVPTLADAVRVGEQPCAVPGCLAHSIIHKDDRGQLRTVRDDDGDAVRGRLSDALRVRERRRLLRARIGYAERQRHRRAANREALQRKDDTDE